MPEAQHGLSSLPPGSVPASGKEVCRAEYLPLVSNAQGRCGRY